MTRPAAKAAGFFVGQGQMPLFAKDRESVVCCNELSFRLPFRSGLLIVEAKSRYLQRPQLAAFALFLAGLFLLFTPRSREFLTDYALFACIAYSFCWPRDPKRPYGEYMRDPATIAVAALLSLGSFVLIYSMIVGH